MAMQATIQRWYDSDLYLSSLMASLEKMGSANRTLFAGIINDLCDTILRQKPVGELLEDLSCEHVDSISKCKHNRRWYDHDAPLKRAFLKLYLLSTQQRREVAAHLFIPTILVERYETYCRVQDNMPSTQVICAMIDTCFRNAPERALKLYGVYLDIPIHKNASKPPAPRPATLHQMDLLPLVLD